jgi:beta-lactamase regulating signal transducer with metallopeptidase domain
MTTSYFVRLVLLMSAVSFLLRVALEAAVSVIAGRAIARAEALSAELGARLLLTLRLLPSAAALVFVAVFCVPSYLRFEPPSASEEVGAACVIAAMCGILMAGYAMFRAARALRASRKYQIAEGIALAGIVRPRLLISERARRELSDEQLDAALAHEQAHRRSMDNLKRLLILLAPALLPASRAVEKAWVRCAEHAADDRAVNGDPGRAVALAEALVAVARMQTKAPALIATLIDAEDDLTSRVERLLAPRTTIAPRSQAWLWSVPAAALALAMMPGTMHAVHTLLERLLD